MAANDIIEHQFPKGVSGNPNGRPKGSLNSKTILEKLLAGEEVIKDKNGNVVYTMSREEYMHLQQIKQAMKGNTRAYKEILDRTEGAVKKEVELSGEVSTPQVTVYLPDNGRTPKEGD